MIFQDTYSPRTLVIRPPTEAAPMTNSGLTWPTADPGDILDYYLDVTYPIAICQDTISRVNITVSPTGTGELQVLALAYRGYVIGTKLGGGVSGRLYTITAQAIGASGRTWQWHVSMAISRRYLAFPPLDPAN